MNDLKATTRVPSRNFSDRASRILSRFLLIIMVSLVPALVLGAPSWGDEFTLEQPDGTEVQVRIWGDEFYRVVESLDGFTLVRDSDTGEICYADLSENGRELLSTGFIVGGVSGEDLGLDRHLRIDPDAARAIAQSLRDEAAAIERAELATKDAADTPMPSTLGDVKGILLLIDFSDEPASIPASAVEDYANLPGYTGYGNNGSVRDYFHDVSNGALTYTNFVPTAWFRASKPKSYYDDCDAPYGTRARELVREALTYLNNQGLDFSEYDANDDGYIDAINCFYAGTTSCGWALGLWPHSGTGLNFSADGVTSYRYQVTGMGSSLTLGTFCHENGHMIGFWPDLYDYDGSSSGVGRFCLMCSVTSNTNPQEPCAYMKDLAGWANIVDLDFFQQNIPVIAGSNTIYRYSAGYFDYYLIENLQRSGRDVGLPDSGLAIWHCDPTGSNNDEDQTYSLHYEVTLVQADGDWDLENHVNYGDSSDLWAGPGYTTFGPDTDPSAYWWNSAPCGLNIVDISYSGATMTFTFNPDGGLNVPGDYTSIQSAIVAADNGQEIVLADGVFTGAGNRDLDFLGKQLILRSGSGDPTQCILDLEGGAGDEHRAFIFSTGETSTAVVEGITIRNGYSTGNGGAILLDGASPTLRDIIFQNNQAVGGGGVYCDAASPILEGCTFYGNSADDGQALACVNSSLPVLSRVLISGSSGSGEPVYCASPADVATFGCSDIFGNINGDWVGGILSQLGVDGNFSLDPMFCDEVSGDFTLRENSPCAPGWHPDGAIACGGLLIGAGPVGCNLTLFNPITTGPVAVAGDSRTVAIGDYDGDGDPDIFIVNHNEADVLLRNEGDGVFSDATVAPLGDAGAGTNASWADYDNDGDLDLYLAKLNEADIIYRNEGGGTFVDANLMSMGDTGPGVDVSWVDYDNDGLLDIYLIKDGQANVMYRGLGGPGGGDWYFMTITDAWLGGVGNSSSADWCDYDNDGDQDVLLSTSSRNFLLGNFGVLGFYDMTEASPLGGSSNSAGADWGDMDNDGFMDVYIANISSPDLLVENNDGMFIQSADPDLVDAGPGQGGAWGDFDNDGLLDFFLARDGEADLFYWNLGKGCFNPVLVPEGAGNSHGMAWADFDGDGDLDIYVARDGANLMLMNIHDPGHHWLHVRLIGTTANASAIGSRLRLVVGDLELVRDVQSSSGYLSQGSMLVEFGLGTATAIDSLVVEWSSGAVEVSYNLPIDRIVKITEGGGSSALGESRIAAEFALRGNAPNPFNPSTVIRYELPVKSAVDLQIFDLRGRLVRSLRSGVMEEAGPRQVLWNGLDSGGRQVSSGTYFYRLEAGNHEAVRRMVLLK
ncbi:MAG: M6 family metalloprotease domain-containing protein [Gemmatimonadales bacterium]|nr:M6 family metalloprotease domain-containing protein [Gemmatimonadales bacterium]